MRRRIANIAIIILAFAIQNCIFPFIPFLSASPNFMTILVFSYGFIYGREEGMLYGMIAGILMDLFYSVPIGLFMLLYLWMGYINGFLSRYFYEDYIVLPLVMCSFNALGYNLYIYFMRFLFRAKFQLGFYLRSMMIPEMIMTLLFTLLLYRLLLVYNRRLEEIDIKRGKEIA